MPWWKSLPGGGTECISHAEGPTGLPFDGKRRILRGMRDKLGSTQWGEPWLLLGTPLGHRQHSRPWGLRVDDQAGSLFRPRPRVPGADTWLLAAAGGTRRVTHVAVGGGGGGEGSKGHFSRSD